MKSSPTKVVDIFKTAVTSRFRYASLIAVSYSFCTFNTKTSFLDKPFTFKLNFVNFFPKDHANSEVTWGLKLELDQKLFSSKLK